MSCKIPSACPFCPGIFSQPFHSLAFHAVFFLKSMWGFEVPFDSGDWNTKMFLKRDKSAQHGVKTLQTSYLHFLPLLSIILFKISIILYYKKATDIVIWTIIKPSPLKTLLNIIPLPFWVCPCLVFFFLLWK